MWTVEVSFLKVGTGQLDPLTVYLFMSRDMYTEKTAQRVMIYVLRGFRVPAAKSSPRDAECRMLSFPIEEGAIRVSSKQTKINFG
jgi:hypothetical protein